MQTLERVSEPYVQVNRVHGKRDGLEILLKDVVQAPREVGVDVQVLEGAPLAAHLHAPLELTQVVGEVIGGYAFAGEVDARTRGIRRTQVSFIHISREVAVYQIREIGACHDFPAAAYLVVGQHGQGEVRVVHLGLHVSRP